MTLDREFGDDTIQELPASSMDTKGLQKGFVAMLNLDKNRIIKVFCDQKAAAEDRKFKGVAPISRAVKIFSQSGGHYFKMWYDCDQNLKEEFLSRDELPSKRVATNAKVIEQLHPFSGIVVNRHSSIEDVVKTFKISRGSLADAIKYNYICKSYKWAQVS
jgi:hypothetical protein